MRSLKGVVVVSLILGTLAVLGVQASASTSGAVVKAQTIHLLEVQTSFVGTAGSDTNSNNPPQVGQGYVLGSDFYKWAGTKRGAHVGTLQIVCTFTKVTTSAVWEVCTGAALLSGGQITVAGSLKQGPQLEVPVVGGTGVYAGARGYARVQSIGNGTTGKSADTIVITG